MKYLRLVGEKEGTHFLGRRPSFISQEEWDELQEIAKASDKKENWTPDLISRLTSALLQGDQNGTYLTVADTNLIEDIREALKGKGK
jgi:hypothetical protein